MKGVTFPNLQDISPPDTYRGHLMENTWEL